MAVRCQNQQIVLREFAIFPIQIRKSKREDTTVDVQQAFELSVLCGADAKDRRPVTLSHRPYGPLTDKLIGVLPTAWLRYV